MLIKIYFKEKNWDGPQLQEENQKKPKILDNPG